MLKKSQLCIVALLVMFAYTTVSFGAQTVQAAENLPACKATVRILQLQG